MNNYHSYVREKDKKCVDSFVCEKDKKIDESFVCEKIKSELTVLL